jgi:D-ribose pyranase
LLSLLARVRHTNALVIADRGFPFWPDIETVDISLTDDVPTVLHVLAVIRPDFHIAQAYMAREFQKHNAPATRNRFAKALAGVAVSLRTACEVQATGARSHRIDSHRRHYSVREHDSFLFG